MWNFLELILSPTSRLLPFANYRQSFHYVMGENGSRAWCHLRTNKLAPLLPFIALKAADCARCYVLPADAAQGDKLAFGA